MVPKPFWERKRPCHLNEREEDENNQQDARTAEEDRCAGSR